MRILLQISNIAGYRFHKLPEFIDHLRPGTWLNPATSSCSLLKPAKEPGVLLRDFNAGYMTPRKITWAAVNEYVRRLG